MSSSAFTDVTVWSMLANGTVSDIPWPIDAIGLLAIFVIGFFLLYRHGKWRKVSHGNSDTSNITTTQPLRQKINSKGDQQIDFFRSERTKEPQINKGFDREIQDVKMNSEIHRPPLRKIYNISVVGISGSGKTSLLSKLVNPQVNLNEISSTGRHAKYERTLGVSTNEKTQLRTEHTLRFHEWGGEYIVQSQSDMLGMLSPQKEHSIEGARTRVLTGIQAMVFVLMFQSQHTANQFPHGTQLVWSVFEGKPKNIFLYTR